MTITWRNARGAAALALLWTGCDTAPPGGGLTNGQPPMLGGPEKAAERTDMPAPNRTGGDAGLADSVATSPAGPGNDAGTGGRNGGQGGTAPTADARQTSPEAASTPPASPPKIEASGENGAQGGTKPPGNINTGTPRSPQ